MDDRWRPDDRLRDTRPPAQSSAPATPYYRDRYPESRAARGYEPDGRRFEARDRGRDWDRERGERDRHPLENTGFRSSSAGYAPGPSRHDDLANSSRRWPEPRSRDSAGIPQRGRVRSWNSSGSWDGDGRIPVMREKRVDNEAGRSEYTISPPADRFGNRPSASRPTDRARHTLISPPRVAPRRQSLHRSQSPRTTIPRHASFSNPSMSQPAPQRIPSPARRPTCSRGAFSDGEAPTPFTNYQSLLSRMEPRASSVDHEPTSSRRTHSQELRPLEGGGLKGESKYEKELGEISPEMEKKVVTGFVPLPGAAGDAKERDAGRAMVDGGSKAKVDPPTEKSDSEAPSMAQMPIKEPQGGLPPVDTAEGPVVDPAEEPNQRMQDSPTNEPPKNKDTSAPIFEAPAVSAAAIPSPASQMDLDPPDESKESAVSNVRSPKPVTAISAAGGPVHPVLKTDIVVATGIESPKPAPEVAEDATIPQVDPTMAASSYTEPALVDEEIVDVEQTDAERAGASRAPNAATIPSSETLLRRTAQIEPSSAEAGPVMDETPLAAGEPGLQEDVIMEDAVTEDTPHVPELSTDLPQTAIPETSTTDDSVNDIAMDGVSASKVSPEESAAAGSEKASKELSAGGAVDDAAVDIAMESTVVTGDSVDCTDGLSTTLVRQGTGVALESAIETGPVPNTQERTATGSVLTAPSAAQTEVDRILHSDPDSSDLTSLPSHDTMSSSRRTDPEAATSERPPQTESRPAEVPADRAQAGQDLPGQDHESTLAERQDPEQDKNANVEPTTTVLSETPDHRAQAAAGPSHSYQQNSPGAVLANGALTDAAGPSNAFDHEATAGPIRPSPPANVDARQTEEPEDERKSPTPPPIAQRPPPKPVDPRVLQRMLERQLLIGRQSIMGHTREKQRELEEKVNQLKSQYRKLDKQWESHKTRIIAENEELARQLEAVPNPAAAQDPKPGGRKTRRGFVEQDHELMGFRDGDEEALAKALKAIEEMMEADPTQRALKTEATIPDMELDPDIWRLAYDDENALVTDPLAFYGHGVGEAPGEWTEEEERKFRKLYAAYPKQFGEIAKGLPNKTTAQCVKHYYLTKKKRPFKEGANRNGQRQATGGQAARMVAPVTREKVELAGVLATGDRAHAKQVADNIRPQGEGRKSGKRKADEAEKSGDQGSKDGQKAKRKSGKKRMVDVATAGDRAANDEIAASKKRKVLKKPSRLDLKDRGQSASNRSSSSRGPSTGPPTSEFPLPKGPQPGVFMPEPSALPHRLVNHAPKRPQSTPIVTWQDQQTRRGSALQEASSPDRTVRETQTLPPENALERRHGGMAIMSLLNDVATAGPSRQANPTSVADGTTEGRP